MPKSKRAPQPKTPRYVAILRTKLASHDGPSYWIGKRCGNRWAWSGLVMIARSTNDEPAIVRRRAELICRALNQQSSGRK